MNKFDDFFSNSDSVFLEKTKNNANQVAPRLYWLHHLLLQEVSLLLKAYDLTFADLDILSNFLHLGEKILTPSQLASKSLLTAGALTSILRKLEVQGLVKRIISQEDKRIKPVLITKKGSILIEKAFDALLKKERDLFSDLSEEQMNKNIHSLDNLIESIEKNK